MLACRSLSRKFIFAIILVSCVVGLSLLVYTSKNFTSGRIFWVGDFEIKRYNPLNYFNKLVWDKLDNFTETFTPNQNLTFDPAGDDKTKNTSIRSSSARTYRNLSLNDKEQVKSVVTQITNPQSRTGSTRNSSVTNSTMSQRGFALNSSLTMPCKKSPFIDCSQSEVPNVTHGFYLITLIRWPVWFHIPDLNKTSCPYKNCRMLDSPITNQTDLVLWYGVGLSESFSFQPEWSHLPQALAVWESPVNTHSNFISNMSSNWNHRINLLMSYRVASELFVPYSKLRFQPTPTDQRPDYYEIARNKTRTAYWFVSHCNTQSRREAYVKEMQKYVDVDIYGHCGQPCSNTTVCTGLETKYKFYLSFENSLCTDYLTEKFFKMFAPNTHVIPVVRSAIDLKKYFPEKTFIDASDFKSAKDLALYLKQLASDWEQYSRYLQAKDVYRSSENIDFMCLTCSYLNSHKTIDTSKKHNLSSIIGLGECREPKDL